MKLIPVENDGHTEYINPETITKIWPIGTAHRINFVCGAYFVTREPITKLLKRLEES